MGFKRNQHRKPTYTIAVVVEGSCEKWYFQLLSQNLKLTGLQIFPRLAQKKKLKDQYTQCKKLSEEHDHVFWIVDFDILRKETQVQNQGKITPVQQLFKYLKDLENNNKITLIVNNPCFEFWLLLHYNPTHRFYESYDALSRDLKKHIKNYEKTESFYKKYNDDLFSKLKPYLTNATENAKGCTDFGEGNTDAAVCGMYLFFEHEKIKIAMANSLL